MKAALIFQSYPSSRHIWEKVGYLLFSTQCGPDSVGWSCYSLKFMRLLHDSFHLLLGHLGFWLMDRYSHGSKTRMKRSCLKSAQWIRRILVLRGDFHDILEIYSKLIWLGVIQCGTKQYLSWKNPSSVSTSMETLLSFSQMQPFTLLLCGSQTISRVAGRGKH